MKSNLKKIRKLRNLTLQKLSDICGVSTSHLSNLQIDKSYTEPTLRKARAIAKALDATLDDIWPIEE